MVTTRAQKAVTPKKKFARKVAAKKILRRLKAGKGLAPKFRRGKKSYEEGNVVKEIDFAKKTPWVGKIGFPYRKFFEHKSNTGEFQYGPSYNVRNRATRTRLVSRRCKSKNECKEWAGEWDGKRYYKKYSKETFYPQAAALARRKRYNKAEERGGFGFIISYRKALARRKRQLAAQRLAAARRRAAANAAARAAAARASVAARTRASKRKRPNVNQSAVVSGKRIRRQPQRFA